MSVATTENTPLLQWDDIRYFLEVAQAGSFNSAARRLGVDQTTVGRRVRALESRLGAHLFDRKENRLLLTQDGESALEDALRMNEVVESFARKLSGSDARVAGQVRLNLTEGLATYWLLPRLQDFQQLHPDLRINWFISDKRYEIGREVDIMIRWTRPTEAKAIARKLGEVGYSLFATKAYQEKYGIPTSVEELAHHKLLHFNSYEMNPGLNRWNELIREYPPLMRLDNTSVAHAVFRSGSVLTLFPNYAQCIDPSFIRVPIDLGISLAVWMSYHEDQRRSRRNRLVTDEIVRLFDKDRGTWFI